MYSESPSRKYIPYFLIFKSYFTNHTFYFKLYTLHYSGIYMSKKITHLKELESEAIYVSQVHQVFHVGDCERQLLGVLRSGSTSRYILKLNKCPGILIELCSEVALVNDGQIHLTDVRDELVERLCVKLIVGSVQQSIDEGRAIEEKGYNASRNKLQTVTLLDTLEKYKFGAALGGARRDEEKARAKERFFSHRDEFGQWDPKNQRPELWNIFNGKKNLGEHFRVFPISNWTEMDVWQYIYLENIPLPSLYYTHEREVFERDGVWLAYYPFMQLKPDEKVVTKRVRCRTIGDITCTGLTLSTANSIEDIIDEIASSRVTERGGRADDKRSEAAMEDRKKAGYF